MSPPKKRPPIIEGLEITPEVEPDAPAPSKSRVVKMRAPKAAPPPSEASPVVRSSIYLSQAAHDRLREIAFVERKKVHDLIVEGVDAVIARRGHSETAKRKS